MRLIARTCSVVPTLPKLDARLRAPGHDVGVTVYGSLGVLTDAQLPCARALRGCPQAPVGSDSPQAISVHSAQPDSRFGEGPTRGRPLE